MILQLLSHFATTGTCYYNQSSLLGFPTWFHYLPGAIDPATNACSPTINSLSDIWLIVAAVVEILLRLAALIAIAMVIYGSVEYIRSRGEPDKTSKAQSTIINALVGLVIAIIAATLVSFIAGGFKAS